MAACSSLEHIFEKSLADSPTLLHSLLPWNHITSMNCDSSFIVAMEIFGELHFREAKITPSSSNSRYLDDANSSPSSWSVINGNGSSKNGYGTTPYKHSSNSFSSTTSDSLSLCTEGLGSESSDKVEDLLNSKICSSSSTWQQHEERRSSARTPHNEEKRSTADDREAFPPPISCIGRNGKPWVCFKSYRQDGRFILKNIRIPTKEFLHASRENGRLKLYLIHFNDDDDNNNNVHQEGVEEEYIQEENQDYEQEEKSVETSYRSKK